MAQVELTSSHVPWTPIPKPVDWNALGDGSIFAPQVEGAGRPTTSWKDDARARAQYRDATAYSLRHTDRLRASATATTDTGAGLPRRPPAADARSVGEGASHDVPITIVAKDPAVLDKIADWHWDAGLKPGRRRPVWPMEAFRDRFLTAFGPEPAQAR